MDHDSQVPCVLRRAAQFHDLGRHQEALELLAQLDEPWRDSGEAWQLRGVASFALGAWASATAALERASCLIPLTPAAQCSLADCYVRLRLRGVAAVVYLHLAKLKPLEEALAERVAAGLAKVEEHDAALHFCLKRLDQFGENSRLCFLTATLLQKLGQPPEDILRFASRAHFLQPQELSYLIGFAQQLLAAGRADEARRALATVDLGQLECVALLQRLQSLFGRLRECARQAECGDRLRQIGYELSATYRRPKNEW